MDTLLTPEEAAQRLAVSPKSIREWLRQGKLKGVKAGRLWRISEPALLAFLKYGQGKKPMSPEANPFMQVIGCLSGTPLSGEEIEGQLYGEDVR
ncbi:MAG: helix-turn-helix domain-containing protein [Actinobacteria bacterium]|nr:helix-turn-helix domain-containing protein [Actinomycetota bacterium]